MHIDSTDSIIPGGRYHNRRDYMDFPNLGRYDLLYQNNTPLPVEGLTLEGSILEKIKSKDYLVNAPYQSYAYIIKFLREAALDPKVSAIKITLYRLAKNSQIISSLINAAKNGKKVTAFIELKARFDEANNIKWSRSMKEAGVKLIYSDPAIKVHSKIALVKRNNLGQNQCFAVLSTGNFNESTAKFYTDHVLLTSRKEVCDEMLQLFEVLQLKPKRLERAEAKFKEIKEAYEVLTDSQKRAAYDQYGHAAFEQGGMGGGGFGGGADFSDIFGDVFGDIL